MPVRLSPTSILLQPDEADLVFVQAKDAKRHEKEQAKMERRKSLQLEYMHRHRESMQRLNDGGKVLAAKFAVACGVRESGA